MAATISASQRTPRLLCRLLCRQHMYQHAPFLHTETPLQHSIRTAMQTGNHCQIPHILSSANPVSSDPSHNPFSFLARLPPALATRRLDDVLQALLPLRPRSLPHPAYAALLSLLLPTAGLGGRPSAHFPLALAVLQTAIRAGYAPPPSIHAALALCWMHLRRRHRRRPASRILASVRDVGYRPDVRTCNLLISALSFASEAGEAIGVLRGMTGAGCVPDSESYCAVIDACCARGDSSEVETAMELMREMAGGEGMVPRKGTVGRLVAALRRQGQGRAAAEVVRLLEREGCAVGFEEYQSTVEGCLEGGELVMAGKVVVEMSKRGFIPYLKARQRVVEGLAGIGQQELASAVRQSLAEVGS